MIDLHLDLHKIKDLLHDANFSWFVCGGWAIDLFLGQVTRLHKDVDLGIWRGDQLAMQSYLATRGWSLAVANAGMLTPWKIGHFLERPYHTIWCKNEAHNPDFVEVLFNERDRDSFLFRRDLSVKRPFRQAILQSQENLLYLAPEIVLLYKAKQFADPQNHADFTAVWPRLSEESRDWLTKILANQMRIIHG